jgi:hypothetical protein
MSEARKLVNDQTDAARQARLTRLVVWTGCLGLLAVAVMFCATAAFITYMLAT